MIRAVGKSPPTSRTTVEVRGSSLLVPAFLSNSLASPTSRREVPYGSIKRPLRALPTSRGVHSTLHRGGILAPTLRTFGKKRCVQPSFSEAVEGLSHRPPGDCG